MSLSGTKKSDGRSAIQYITEMAEPNEDGVLNDMIITLNKQIDEML